MRFFSKAMFGVCAVLTGALATVILFHGKSWGRDSAPVINVETTPVNRDANLPTSFASIVKKAAPSVVNIYTTRIVRVPTRFAPFFQFPGDGTRKEQILGSGVVVSPDGYIL